MHTPPIAASASARRATGWALGLLLSLAGCANLPMPAHRSASVALPVPTDSALARTAQRSLPQAAQPGFALLPIASTAYRMRLELIERAQHTLDLQYYVFDADSTGAYLLGALKAAADRGVRVRLLVDDLHTADSEQLLREFAAFDGVEVRLFNPVPSGRWSFAARVATSLFDFARFNRRMHNKLFVADNVMALVGGRNIGDEYFMRGTEYNFVDIDMLAVGDVVPQLSRGFDEYWNSDLAYPVDAVVQTTALKGALRDRFARAVAGAAAPAPDLGVPARLARFDRIPAELAAGRLTLTQAPATVYADHVVKGAGAEGRLESASRPTTASSAPRGGTSKAAEPQVLMTVRGHLIELMRQSETEVFVISPYFVPGEIGLMRMRALHQRGVQMRLLTNTLAATDEPLVHVGYSAYRQAMLEAGVEIYELSPQLVRERGRLGRFGASSGRLHAKVAIVDRRLLFIGSMNFDPRSEHVNTELGIVVDSPAMAADFVAMMDYRGSAYRVRLSPHERAMEWVQGRGEEAAEAAGTGEIVHAVEPESSWLLRLRLRLLAPLVPEGDL
jgi:cardiolipin synthase C